MILEYPWQDETRTFECFDNPMSGMINGVILRGHTYPRIEFVDGVRTILDIGANIGASAVWFSLLYPEATIHAFEPGSEPWALFERNTADRPNVVGHHHGLFDRDLVVPLYRGVDDPMTASVSKGSETTEVADSIELRSLPEWMAANDVTEIDILKVDTEGCELPILRSIEALLPSVRVIYLEYHSEDDRKELDRVLGDTHIVVAGHVLQIHRGELTYVARDAFPSHEALMGNAVTVDLA